MRKLIASLCLIITFLVTACSTTTATNPDDPFEPFNRKIFAFNLKFDTYLFRPIAKVYDKILPDFVENRIDNFFDNIDVIPSIVNDILQGRVYYTLNDTWRLAVNTTFGIGGLFDVASEIGLEEHYSDFGLTLARWGYTRTAYFVIPIVGPSTIRDTVGAVGTNYTSVWPFIRPVWLGWSMYGLRAVNLRSQRLADDKLLYEAFDPYVFARNAYIQNRQKHINDEGPAIKDPYAEESGASVVDESDPFVAGDEELSDDSDPFVEGESTEAKDTEAKNEAKEDKENEDNTTPADPLISNLPE